MIAKILIKRKFIRNNATEILPLLMQLRSRAMKQNGYISGENLTNANESDSIAVIATWQTMEAWLNWKDNPERKRREAMLEVFQLEPTIYEEYYLGSTLK